MTAPIRGRSFLRFLDSSGHPEACGKVDVQGSAVVYQSPVYEVVCQWNSTNCTRTGRSIQVRMIVDFKSVNGKTFGLVTTYCMGTVVCPS